MVRYSGRDRGVDRVFRDVALDALVVGPERSFFRQAPYAVFHNAGELPTFGYVFRKTAHSLAVGAEYRDGAHVMEKVLRSHGLWSYARLREGDVLGGVVVQPMPNHGHRNALLEGIGGKRIGGVSRRRDDVWIGVDDEKIGCMAAPGALYVIHVDRTLCDRRNRVLAKAEFVD